MPQRLRPFFSYYGSKWRLAPRYPKPVHDTIIEPFAGSACYSLTYPDRRVRLFDKSEHIVGTWRYLIGASESEIRALPDIAPETLIDDLPIPQEAKWLIGWWANIAATSPRKRASAWTRREGQSSTNAWGTGVRERIASQLHAIRHWTITQGDYRDAGDVEATWFIDPPYQGRAGKRYVHGSDAIDYADLGAWCKSRPGQVIVCENVGADWLPFAPWRQTKGARWQSREAIWLGGRQGHLI
jgi:hypothetical protein